MDRVFILWASSNIYQNQWKGVFNPGGTRICSYRDSETIFLSLNMFLTSCPHIFPPHLRKLMTADALYHTFED